MVPGAKTAQLNFARLKELLLSKDLSKDAAFSKSDNDRLRFLDGKTDMTGNMVAF